MAVSLKQLDGLVRSAKGDYKHEFEYPGDIIIHVNTNLSIEQRQSFVDKVVKNAYIDGHNYSPVNVDVAFAIELIEYCTDIKMPTKKVDGKTIVDAQKAYDIACALDLVDKLIEYDEIRRLRQLVDDKIAHQNNTLAAFAGSSTATEDAIELINDILRKVLDALSVGEDFNSVNAIQNAYLDAVKEADGNSDVVNIGDVIAKAVGDKSDKNQFEN